jgi:hypothetical protein
MSVAGLGPVSMLTRVNGVNGTHRGHWQRPRVDPTPGHVSLRRRSCSGDQSNGGVSPELAGIALGGSISCAVCCVRTSVRRRISW